MASKSLNYRENSSAVFAHHKGEAPVPARANDRLAVLATLASTDIETSLVANLSDDLHTLFDPISDGTLPIYFGPLLGRLYLEGL